jgi:lipopolysaccharide export system protein LptA
VTVDPVLVRRASLILLVLWLVVVAVTSVERRVRQRAGSEPQTFAVVTPLSEEAPLRVQHGFNYTDTVGVEPIFRVAAREAMEFPSGWYELTDVEMSLYHGGEVAYGLLAPRARYEPTKHSAQTSGQAHLSLRRGVALRADGFILHGPERLLESQGPVSFAGPGWGGIASSATCSLATNTLELVGGVSMTWRRAGGADVPSLVLLASRLTYDRKRGVARFPEGVKLLRGQVRGQAGAAEVTLNGPEGELRKITLEPPVTLAGVLDDGGNVAGETGAVEIEVLSDGKIRLGAEAALAHGWAMLTWQEAGGSWRELHSWRLQGEGTSTAWDWLEGHGLACGDELDVHGEPRRIEAGRLRLVFQEGQPSTVLAREGVHLASADKSAVGDAWDYSLRSRTYVLIPAKDERIELMSAGAHCWASALEGGDDGATARGKVSGFIEHGGLPGSGGKPVRFAAEEAKLATDGDRVVLGGDAKLWQEESLLRADQIEVERARDRLTARGGVLTAMPAATAKGRAGEIRVRARQLRYERAAGTATYEGEVVLEDAQADATCQKLVVRLDERGAVTEAELDQGVSIHDRGVGRTLRGERARLYAREELYELWGTPVVASDPKGNQVKADHLAWRRATDVVSVLGKDDRPSETLYRPDTPVTTPRRGRTP